MSEPRDDDLVERVRVGCPETLATLYDRYAVGVHRAAYSLLHSASEAEDVVQDVFLGLPRALRSYAGRGSLQAWIHRVAVRTALMRLRARRRRREDALGMEGPGPRAPGDSPVERVALERAIAGLPDGLRVVFVLKVVEGYSHDEVAELVGITTGTSKVRLFRARKCLQDLLS